MRVDCVRSIPVERTARVLQLEGLFDVPPTRRSELRWTANLPLEDRPWNIGLIVGPSGCGKTTLAGELFPEGLVQDFAWPEDQCLVDGFPAELSIKEITQLLSSVGLSSVPSWLRPFHVLSNGEQFRATMARALAEAGKNQGQRDVINKPQSTIVVDEFTSVVDRTVARIGSAAIAKAVRSRQQRFVAVSCHYDIIDWLDPDWIYEPAGDSFQWRRERQGDGREERGSAGERAVEHNSAKQRRRPPITLDVIRVHHQAWKIFGPHHYLSGDINRAARCFVGLVEDQPATFTAVLYFPHPRRSGWREHRTVCLPDFQGVSLGNAMSDFVASVFRATGRPYFSTTSSPAMIYRRAASPDWLLKRLPGRKGDRRRSSARLPGLARTMAYNRFTASFEYVGPGRSTESRNFGLLSDSSLGRV